MGENIYIRIPIHIPARKMVFFMSLEIANKDIGVILILAQYISKFNCRLIDRNWNGTTITYY